MKQIALTLTLAAMLAAPLAASAETQTAAAPMPGGNFLVIDPQTGRTVATLVSVPGKPHELRIVGAASTQRSDATQPAIPGALLLTPAQFEDAAKALIREQFYIAPDAGSRG